MHNVLLAVVAFALRPLSSYPASSMIGSILEFHGAYPIIASIDIRGVSQHNCSEVRLCN